MNNYDEINIKNLEIFAKHGVFPEENKLGQKFLVSATLYCNTRIAGKKDELENSVDYGNVSHFIKKIMEENVYKLIEKVAEELATNILLEYKLVNAVEIEVKKPWAPVGLPLDTVSVKIKRGWHKAYIALSSNMGDRETYLKEAIKKVDNNRYCKVLNVADFIETKPYGGVEQDDFLNGMIEVDTMLSPEELLDELNRIEAQADRKREIHWGPRTLDLDIIFYDKEIIDNQKLHIPHIEMHKRDFVLKPLAQIAPWYRHPILNKTVEELLEEL